MIERLFEYDNYRKFLLDFIEEERTLRTGFSQRSFAMRFGLRSSGAMSLILSGARNMGEATLQMLPKAVGISGRPAAFLLALARFNQAQHLEARTSTFEELKKLRRNGRFARTHAHQYAYWDEWYHVVVRELAVHPGWNGDPARLAAMVRPAITPEKARRSLERLREMGLLRLEPDGSYAKCDQVVSAEGAPGALLREFKREMMLRGLQCMDDLPPSKRHFSTATMAMTRASYRSLCDRIDALRAEFLQAATEEEPEIVFQVNFQVFPVSREMSAEDPPRDGGEPRGSTRWMAGSDGNI